MTGEMDLQALLRGMAPDLRRGTYVFCTTQTPPDALRAEALMTFQEDEGVTLIVEREAAERSGVAWTYPCRVITLCVHSSLSAVGFLAAITTRLAAEGISANPVSGFYHDHLFVPEDKADHAMAILQSMTQPA